MDLPIKIKFLNYIIKVLSGQLDTLPLATYTPQKLPAKVDLKKTSTIMRATPEEVGINSYDVIELYKQMNNTANVNLHGLMVLRHGKVIAEGYCKPYKKEFGHISHSMCKSIVGMAIGFLINENKITLSTSLGEIFAKNNTFFACKKVKNITVRNLLTMSTGIEFNELGTVFENDWIKSYLYSDTHFEPGTQFEYNSTNTYMLSVIVRKVTGQGLVDYLTPRLFNPLGITSISWEKCPRGVEKGGWGLTISLEDMAKLGQLYLNKGKWNINDKEVQIIDPNWVKESISNQIKQNCDEITCGYGYQIWTFDDGKFLFNGMLGQNVLVVPKYDMVLAMTAGGNNFFPTGEMMECVLRFINNVNRFIDESLSPNKRAYELLTSTLANMVFLEPLKEYIDINKNHLIKVPSKEKVCLENEYKKNLRLARQLDGKKYSIDEQSAGIMPLMLQCMHNNYSLGISNIGFYFRENVLYIEFLEEEEKVVIPVGLCEPEYSIYKHKKDEYNIGTRGNFTTDEDKHIVLKINISFVETANSRLIKIFFIGKDIEVIMDEIPSLTYIASHVLSGEYSITKGKLPLGLDSEFLKFKLEKILNPKFDGKHIPREKSK